MTMHTHPAAIAVKLKTRGVLRMLRYDPVKTEPSQSRLHTVTTELL